MERQPVMFMDRRLRPRNIPPIMTFKLLLLSAFLSVTSFAEPVRVQIEHVGVLCAFFAGDLKVRVICLGVCSTAQAR